MSRTLLDISDDLQALAALLDAASPEGEVPADQDKIIDEWFATLGAERNRKVDNYVALIRDTELRASVRRAELERLQVRVGVDTALAQRLKDRLKLFLERQGLPRLETDRYKLAICGNGGKARVELLAPVEELLPAYQTICVQPNIEALRTAIELGRNVPARILPRGNHLRIT